MTSELGRIAAELLAVLDEIPDTVEQLHKYSEKTKRQAAHIGDLSGGTDQGRHCALLLFDAAQRIDEAAKLAVRAYAQGRPWALSLTNIVTLSTTAASDRRRLATPPKYATDVEGNLSKAQIYSGGRWTDGAQQQGGGDIGDGAEANPKDAQAPGGHGQWENVHESMSERAATYQEQITGQPINRGYVVTLDDGSTVKFDGLEGHNHLDAKGPGYKNFVNKDGEFYDWWRGSKRFADQAGRQVEAANGDPVIWSFAEDEAAEATADLFDERRITGIIVKVEPPREG